MEYFSTNIFLAILVLFLLLLVFLFKRRILLLTPKSLLLVSYLSIGLVCIQPFFSKIISKKDFSNSYVQVWSASDNDKVSKNSSNLALLSVQNEKITTPTIDLNLFTNSVTMLFFIGFLFVFFNLISSFKKLNKIIKSAYKIRIHNNVIIIASQKIEVPFSFLFFKKAYVIIPENFITSPRLFKISILHELQHHRNKDTLTLYLLLLLKAVFFWNPFVHILEKTVTQLQEFACDEALVSHGRVSCRAYAESLYEVALCCLNKQNMLAGTASMASFTSDNILIRRIKFMSHYSNRKGTKFFAIVCFVLLTIVSFSTVIASQGIISDKRITMEEAKKLFSNAKSNTNFQLVLNDSVLEQLNYFLGTQEGRSWVTSSLKRMENYKTGIQEKIRTNNLPEELLAIPFIESGFVNEPELKNRNGAGLWQFIPGTARHFNLRVDRTVDERLNVDLATNAALQYLNANYNRFQNWGLAIMAYNVGEKGIQKGIDKTGSKDPWVLVKKGFENDSHYLAKFYAAVIILKNPNVVN